jgi:uncharacterized membrane protein YeaQ/YmgE (transglycosylase-associated protein family)
MEHGIIAWLIIGAIAGWLAGVLVKGGGFGLIVDIIVGIVGAFIGGWLAGVLHISLGGGWISSIITAVIGAVHPADQARSLALAASGDSARLTSAALLIVCRQSHQHGVLFQHRAGLVQACMPGECPLQSVRRLAALLQCILVVVT